MPSEMAQANRNLRITLRSCSGGFPFVIKYKPHVSMTPKVRSFVRKRQCAWPKKIDSPHGPVTNSPNGLSTVSKYVVNCNTSIRVVVNRQTRATIDGCGLVSAIK